MVGIDKMESLTETARKNKYVIIWIDHFTKYLEAEPLKNIRSDTIAALSVDEIVLRHGAIEKVMNDQGRSFCSNFMESVFKLTKSKCVMATAYHPETNGLSERVVRTLRASMSHYINESHSSLDI